MSEPAQKRINQTLKNQLSEALDKIEELEAKIQKMALDQLTAEGQLWELSAENKRLKEALIDIGGYQNLQADPAYSTVEECREIANEALQEVDDV